MKNISESLAGRIAVFDMAPLSLYELEDISQKQKSFLPSVNPPSLLKRKDVNKTFEIIWKGFYPSVALDKNVAWQSFYDAYIRTYIERDLRDIVKISNEMVFLQFLKVIAARTAQQLDIADMAKDVDVSFNTVKNWLSILQTSGIVYLLQPYFANITKRIVKKPKLYFTDTGLCAYLTHWDNPKVLQDGAMKGAIFETFVMNEIVKSYKHNGLRPNFYYYRDSLGAEIDLLIEKNGTVYPIEIKKSANPKRRRY